MANCERKTKALALSSLGLEERSSFLLDKHERRKPKMGGLNR